MSIRIRFFARFGELLGTDIDIEEEKDLTLESLVKNVAGKNQQAYDLIFDELGKFRDIVILMQNGKRINNADAKKTILESGDDIAVFPPVAGG
jgi:molybdopterin synthase sulfur carrier subunit